MNTPHITEWSKGKVTSHTFDRRLGQVACFVAAVLVLTLSLWKLARLELTEAELFFGVLLCFATPLLFIIIGLLLPNATATKAA